MTHSRPCGKLIGLRQPTTRRRCLCCRALFDSTGPGNRMCPKCRAHAADISPLAP